MKRGYEDDVCVIETGTQIMNGYGAIYVPADFVDTYKSASNWSTFADKIYPISEYPKVDYGTITDSWAEIFVAEDNGTYKTKYSVGDTKSVDVGGAIVLMQIAAFDEDTSKITWLCKDIYENHVMNSTGTTSGGWPATEMRTYLTEEIYNNIASSVKSRIVQVSKTYYDYSTSSTKTSDDYVWIPSYREVNFGTDRENSGIVYSGLFTDSGTGSSTARVKNYNGSAHGWWLRSANSSSNFYNVNNNGSNNNNANNTNGVVFGSSSARQSKHSAEIGAVGEKESITHVRRTSVNICHDKPGRTLLAWRRLMVNPSFHANWFYAPDATIHSGVRGIPYIYMTSKERHEGQVQR